MIEVDSAGIPQRTAVEYAQIEPLASLEPAALDVLDHAAEERRHRTPAPVVPSFTRDDGDDLWSVTFDYKSDAADLVAEVVASVERAVAAAGLSVESHKDLPPKGSPA